MVGKVLLVGALAVPAAATATVAATGVAWIDVKEGGPGGHRIVLPVPLLLAEVAASFVPDKEIPTGLQEARERLRSAGNVLKVLSESPDGEYVRVEERDEQVVITKRGDTLHVSVHGPREDIEVNVPLAAVADVLDDEGNISARRAVRLLRHARFSTLVDVRDGDDHVKITVF